MPWIELHDNLADHAKTCAVADALKLDKDAVVGKLCRLWSWALTERPDGFIPAYDVKTLAEKMRWTKNPMRLIEALCFVPRGCTGGFLDRVDDGYVIHEWDAYVKHWKQYLITLEKDRIRKQQKNGIPPEIPSEIPRKIKGNTQDFRQKESGNPSESYRKSGVNPSATVTNTVTYSYGDDDDIPTTEDMRTREGVPSVEQIEAWMREDGLPVTAPEAFEYYLKQTPNERQRHVLRELEQQYGRDVLWRAMKKASESENPITSLGAYIQAVALDIRQRDEMELDELETGQKIDQMAEERLREIKARAGLL